MTEHRPLEIIDLQQNGKEYILTTSFNGHEHTHPVEIVDQRGVFGVTLPDELVCILKNDYTFDEAEKFMDNIKEKYFKLL